jgi:hypothetical protein
MGLRAEIAGDAGSYRIRGAVWELGSSSYRAYVHVFPATPRPDLSRSVVSADGMTLQEVVGAAKAQVRSTVGMPVERLEVRTIPRMSDRLLWLDRSRG